jgi:hypothetical protein
VQGALLLGNGLQCNSQSLKGSHPFVL